VTPSPDRIARFSHGSRVPGWDEPVDLELDPAEIPDPATTEVPADLRQEIEEYMARYPERQSAALPALNAVQRRYGWCSPEALEQVACVMRVTPGYLAAVATFYDMLRVEPAPVDTHAIFVCTNISCSLNGADALFDAMRAAAGDDEHFDVRAFECLGACDIAPMASVDGRYVGPLAPADCVRIIGQCRAGEEVLPERQLANRKAADTLAREAGRK
jgi:NADH-quinone oxidoreductase subunit E